MSADRQDVWIDYRLIGDDEAALRAAALEQPGINAASIRISPSRKNPKKKLLYAVITSAPRTT